MNKEEFNKFWDDFVDRFPKNAAPFNRPGTLNSWHEIIEGIELKDAIEINRLVHSEELSLPDYFSWERYPTLVRNEAQRLAVNRRLAEHRSRHDESNSPSDCLCRSTGLVTVYHPEQIIAALKGKEIKSFGNAAVPCTCRFGEKFWYTQKFTDGKRVITERERYDPHRHCHKPYNDKTPEDTIKNWYATRQPSNYSQEIANWNA